jgi:hypothetical protein
MNILRPAIENKAIGSAIESDVGGRFYYRDADNGGYPRVVFSRVSGVPDNAFAKTGESVIVQFDLFSMKSAGGAEIEKMETDLKALFDDCTLTLTGKALAAFQRTNVIGPMDEEMDALSDGTTTILHTAIDYEATYQTA